MSRVYRLNGPHSHLTQREIQKIIDLYATGKYTQLEVSKLCDVCQFTVGKYTKNVVDRDIPRRHRAGEWKNKKLTIVQAQAVRDMYAAGLLSQKKIAEKFGVSQTMVSFIVNDLHWNETVPK
jgi:DNA-binding XRE family transcriptional regulator